MSAQRSLPFGDRLPHPWPGLEHAAPDGATYDPLLDKDRLRSLLGRVFSLMADGRWRTLAEIRQRTGGSEASVSARLRDLRKPKFGGYEVEHRRKAGGIWQYRLHV